MVNLGNPDPLTNVPVDEQQASVWPNNHTTRWRHNDYITDSSVFILMKTLESVNFNGYVSFMLLTLHRQMICWIYHHRRRRRRFCVHLQRWPADITMFIVLDTVKTSANKNVFKCLLKVAGVG